MRVKRDLAINILKYLYENPKFYFPFLVMCKEYTPEDDDFVEIEPNEWKLIQSDDIYQTFELWENLQHLYKWTTELLAKWFIEKILKKYILKNYIFLTFEWFTQEPNSNEIENVQMIGISEGINSKKAFKKLQKENEWLQKSSFNEIYCHELANNEYEYFYLK